MSFTILMKERDSIAGTPVYNQQLNNSNGTTGLVNIGRFNRVSFIGAIGGNSGNAASINCYVQETNTTTSVGTNIAGAALTNFSLANQTFTIELNAMQTTKQFVYAVITASQPANCTLIPYATEARYNPANNNDDASVTQRVALGY